MHQDDPERKEMLAIVVEKIRKCTLRLAPASKKVLKAKEDLDAKYLSHSKMFDDYSRQSKKDIDRWQRQLEKVATNAETARISAEVFVRDTRRSRGHRSPNTCCRRRSNRAVV